MTKNQIAYQDYLENMRNHLATEYETNRSNVARERENTRHAIVTEGISKDNLTELNRANKAKEQQAKRELRETRKHNRNTEAEQSRGNTLNYSAKIQQIQNDLTIARESNASRERISQLERELQYWKTQQDNASRERVANTQASATMYAANVAASAAKYSADLNRLSNREANLTKEQIAEADRIARLNTAAADRALNAIKIGNEYEINKAANELKKVANDIEKQYKEGLITNKQYEILLQANRDQMNNMFNTLDAVTGPLRDLAGIFKISGNVNNSNVRRYN